MRFFPLIVLSAISIVVAFDAEAPTASPRDADTSLASPVVEKSVHEVDELKRSIATKVKKLRALKLEARQLQVQLKRDRRAKAAVSGTGFESEHVRLKKWKHRMQRRVKEMLKRVVRMEKTMKERKSDLRQQMQRAKASLMASRVQEKHKVKKVQHGQAHPKKLHHQKIKKSDKTTTTMPTPVLTTPQSLKHLQTTPTLAHTSLTTAAMSLVTESQNLKQKRSHSIGTDGYPCATHKQCAPGHCCHRFGAINSVQASVCLQHDLIQGSVCGHSCACQGDMKCVRQVKKGIKNKPTVAHCRHMGVNDVLHTSPSFQFPIHLR